MEPSLSALCRVSAKPIIGSLHQGGRNSGQAGERPRTSLRNRLQNLRAVREGTRGFSAYELRDGTRIWIITEADRSVTTILLPGEY